MEFCDLPPQHAQGGGISQITVPFKSRTGLVRATMGIVAGPVWARATTLQSRMDPINSYGQQWAQQGSTGYRWWKGRSGQNGRNGRNGWNWRKGLNGGEGGMDGISTSKIHSFLLHVQLEQWSMMNNSLIIMSNFTKDCGKIGTAGISQILDMYALQGIIKNVWHHWRGIFVKGQNDSQPLRTLSLKARPPVLILFFICISNSYT